MVLYIGAAVTDANLQAAHVWFLYVKTWLMRFDSV